MYHYNLCNSIVECHLTCSLVHNSIHSRHMALISKRLIHALRCCNIHERDLLPECKNMHNVHAVLLYLNSYLREKNLWCVHLICHVHILAFIIRLYHALYGKFLLFFFCKLFAFIYEVAML